MSTYIPLTYYTYNKRYYVAAWLTFILFIAGFAISMQVFFYEFLNARNTCMPTYYYGQSCRNLISDTINTDVSFINTKQMFYQDSQIYDASLQSMAANSSDANTNISANITNNVTFQTNTLQQVQNISSTIQSLVNQYLANYQAFFRNMSNESSDFYQQFISTLADLKTQIQQTIVQPAYAKYTDPLQKLYKSLNTVVPQASLS
jgi:AAA15 family ATPase/GTPase